MSQRLIERARETAAALTADNFHSEAKVIEDLLLALEHFVADFDAAADAGIDAAVAAERERCAALADTMPGWKQPRDVAAAIRRGVS